MIRDCLCVFANGDGGLTMLFPPLGHGDAAAAMRECLAICEDYNNAARLSHWTRVEYVSEEMLDRLGGDWAVEPMSGDYVYPTRRMIDLDGGDLASKRQARNRFARRHQPRVEMFEPRHVQACLALLNTWTGQTDPPGSSSTSVSIKRTKEVSATAEVVANSGALGLAGMVLYAGDDLAGFTFGEPLGGPETCSILIEKTDRRYAGSANYIFSEFCRLCWPASKWCNVGDDWDVPSLAWTKQSYRPAFRAPKFVLRPRVAAVVPVAEPVKPAARPVPAEPAHRLISV